MTRRSQRRSLLTALGAASIATAILSVVIGIVRPSAADVVAVVDGLCARSHFFHRIPYLCPDQMDINVLCTSPSSNTVSPPCVSFYITNPTAGLDIVGGQFEVAEAFISDSGGYPMGLNSKEATFNAKVTDNDLNVGEKFFFSIERSLTGIGENINIQVCPYYTNPAQQTTLTLRPRLYSQSNEPTLREVESYEIKLRLVGVANPSAKLQPASAIANLAAPPGTSATLESHGCEVSRR